LNDKKISEPVSHLGVSSHSQFSVVYLD